MNRGMVRSFSDAVVTYISDNRERKERVALWAVEAREAGRPEPRYGVAIHPSAVVLGEVGEGTVVMAGAVVQVDAIVGKHCIINTGATVDHHSVVKDYVHIAPGAHLCGSVTVGEGSLVGVGVGIGPGVTIPAWSLVKAARLNVGKLYQGEPA